MLEDCSCAPPGASAAGDDRRAAAYVHWEEARKLRWVCKGVRGCVTATQPQTAAGGRDEHDSTAAAGAKGRGGRGEQ
jgi:hypothetical protein